MVEGRDHLGQGRAAHRAGLLATGGRGQRNGTRRKLRLTMIAPAGENITRGGYETWPLTHTSPKGQEPFQMNITKSDFQSPFRL